MPDKVQLVELARSIRKLLGIERARTPTEVMAMRATRTVRRSELRERLRVAGQALHTALDRTTSERQRARLIRAFAREHTATFEELLTVEPLLPRGASLETQGRPRELEGDLLAAAADTLGVVLPVIVRAVYAHLDPGPEVDAFIEEEYERSRSQAKRRPRKR